MVISCAKTGQHCPMMRRAYQNWIRPKLAGEHSEALRRIEQGRIFATNDLALPVKTQLFEAAFLFQSDSETAVSYPA